MAGSKTLVRFMLAALVTALAVPALGIPSWGQTPVEVRGTAEACGPLNLDGVWLRDVDGYADQTRDAVRCLAAYEISTGYTDRTYRGDLEVQRYHMALFLSRVLDYATAHSDLDLPAEVGNPGFTDLEALSEEAQEAVALLAELDITTGTSATRFSPYASVTRRDMASFLVRLQDVIEADAYDTDEQDLFPDVPATLPRAEHINALGVQGIAGGHADGTYRPFSAVTRAHMALFVMRHVDENVASDRVPDLASVPHEEKTRAAWVHAFDPTLKSRASIEDLVDELVAAEADAVYAQVVRRHDAYYDSQVLPATPDTSLEEGLDVLDELTTQAHAAGLEVHAWVAVAPTWHGAYDNLERPEGWVPIQHGRRAPEGQRWVTRTVDGVWSDYLDPALPEVREHVSAIVAELAEDYPVDGVHLDYVRYQSSRHGYHPDALARFEDETGVSDPEPDDAAWSQWRREQTRAVMEDVGDALDATGSDAELSAAVITWAPGPQEPTRAGFEGTRTFNDTLQDWPEWARDGLVDAVLPMNYFRAHDDYQAASFAQWQRYQQELRATTDTRVLSGVAGYLNAPEDALGQMQAGMQATDGAVMYSYQQPTRDFSRHIWDELADTWWGELVPRD